MKKKWNKYMKAEAPSVFVNKFVDHDNNEIDVNKYIQVIAYGDNFSDDKIHHGDMLFINPNPSIERLKEANIILYNDFVLWYVDWENKIFWRKDDREKPLDIKEIKGTVDFIFDVRDKVKFLD